MGYALITLFCTWYRNFPNNALSGVCVCVCACACMHTCMTGCVRQIQAHKQPDGKAVEGNVSYLLISPYCLS